MSVDINLDLVRHIANLSRIELTEQQMHMFKDHLAAILAYVEKLQELDTENVEPMAHAVDQKNVFAEDRLGKSLTADEALANAPQRDGDFFKVPKILGDS